MASLLVITGCSLTKNMPNNNSSQSNVNVGVNQYTLDEVAKHSTASDCWTIANGKVYDVTSFISEHPGGDKILLGCGKDMTDFFNTKHLKQSKEKLPPFYIGDLK